MDITIIIPTFNRIWSLPKAIESCKAGSGLSKQIIVVDDGSTDGTWEALNKIEGIEIFRQQNWGKPWAVNMAFAHAKGKYIKFLDSDDWLVPGAIEKEFELAEKNGADLVVAGYDVYQDSVYQNTQNWVNCDDFIAQNLGECASSHYSAFLFKKEFIDNIPHRTSFASADFASRDDRCFMLEVALKKPVTAIYEQAAFCHAHHKRGRLQFQKSIGSTCTNYQHQLIYKNVISQLAERGELTKRRIKAAENILWPLCHWIAKDNVNDAAKLFEWVKKIDPEFQIPEKGILGFLYKKLGFKLTEKILRVRRNFQFR